jgi:hypothetical protein
VEVEVKVEVEVEVEVDIDLLLFMEDINIHDLQTDTHSSHELGQSGASLTRLCLY